LINAFDPEIFLEISKQLRRNKNFDLKGRLRTSIGRSYYAAFLKSQLKLQSLGKAFSDDSRIHAEVRDNLQKLKQSNIASKLESLFKMRVKADYKPYAKIDFSLCDSSISISENIINLIDRI